MSKIERLRANNLIKPAYESEVARRVAMRYSPAEESAILRKRLFGSPGSEEEFLAYHSYVEQCKAAVRKEYGMS